MDVSFQRTEAPFDGLDGLRAGLRQQQHLLHLEVGHRERAGQRVAHQRDELAHAPQIVIAVLAQLGRDTPDGCDRQRIDHTGVAAGAVSGGNWDMALLGRLSVGQGPTTAGRRKDGPLVGRDNDAA
jgi:hypothetical protein